MNTMRAIEEKLWVNSSSGGVARYERDYYYHVDGSYERVTGNPWIICTLWLAQWWIALARTRDDLARPRAILEWVADHAAPSGVLAEQLDPYSGKPLSVAPLTWSHATFVETLLQYGAKYRAVETRIGA
jgi:GH15 family glucan-1,4-alpha-glucosidase